MSRTSRATILSTRSSSGKNRSHKILFDSFTSLNLILTGKGPKINMYQKSEMVTRAIEELQVDLDKFIRRTTKAKRNLVAELGEFQARSWEINDAIDTFEYQVVTLGYNQLTQRISAERFHKFMDDWLKGSNGHLEKLRLRYANLKTAYKKVSAQLLQHSEFWGNVHSVDFDQMRIEDKNMEAELEKKKEILTELKRMNGLANMVLTSHKNYMVEQLEKIAFCRQDLIMKQKMVKEEERRKMKAANECSWEQKNLAHFKHLQKTWKVPDIMEYIRLKQNLYELKKTIKVLSRRKNIH